MRDVFRKSLVLLQHLTHHKHRHQAITDEHSGRYRHSTLPHLQTMAKETTMPSKTAVLCIEYQNEFNTEGGKLHGAWDRS